MGITPAKRAIDLGIAIVADPDGSPVEFLQRG